MKVLLTGDEAVARGAYEAGVVFASAYPGTPSTEILENLAKYQEIYTEWAPNEKVALEGAIGASIAGGRAIASMKHVGLNVAADPLFTFAYTGVNGGTVIVNADEPGQYSSQNEQDNRNYAKAAKIPMLEPADSQECLEMTKLAFDISEQFDTPVLIRMTTRVCHSKSPVTLGVREEIPILPYQRNSAKYVCVPAVAKKLRINMEKRTEQLKEYSEETPLNRVEDYQANIGVISSGVCYYYAKEVFGSGVSHLKLGMSWPLPLEKIKDFCAALEKIYIIEENDPYIEEAVCALGFSPLGKEVFPAYGEMTPDVLRQSLFGDTLPTIKHDRADIVNRPPTLCAGCPHRGFFYEIAKLKNVMIAGDIGCYTLGMAPPFNAMDATICMGASFSMGHGAKKVFDMTDTGTKVVSVLGDSTFFHTGINSLLNIAYNQSNTLNVILDNRITGMTGHQENPGSGYTVTGDSVPAIDIEAMVRALGIKHVRTINPNDLDQVKAALNELLPLDEPSVLITRWPCALKKFSPEDKEEFADAFYAKYFVEEETCIGCKLCIKAGCPALSFDTLKKKSIISHDQCLGCGVCAQICPKKAIMEEGK
jgi:indolepyruvate ferredoxin oxidoreductase alpha subunit